MDKIYTRKRPAHQASSHTKSKRWFKQKSRKAMRKYLKNMDR